MTFKDSYHVGQGVWCAYNPEKSGTIVAIGVDGEIEVEWAWGKNTLCTPEDLMDY